MESEIINESNYTTIKQKFKVFPNLITLNQKRFTKPDYKHDYQGVDKIVGVIPGFSNWKFKNG